MADRRAISTRAWRRVGAIAILALLPLAFAACRRPAPPPPAASVVFILVDTLRADHLGVYGYARPTSPTIDGLAAESLVFRHARSVAPWTNPTIASLFTGRRPTAVLEPALHRQASHTRLPPELPLLAEKLQAAGLRTAALVDHPGISPGLGFARGFETFTRTFEGADRPRWGFTDGKIVLEAFARQLQAFGDERFFLYLHLVYPHRPYAPPPPYDTMFGEITDKTTREFREPMINAYDAEIRYTDDVVRDLLAELARQGRLDESWIVLTSDHGEGFWEHGRDEHGNSLFDELLRVPLIVRPPKSAGIAPRSITSPVSLLDLHATVLQAAAGDRLAAERAERGGGRSLLRYLDGEGPALIDDVVSQQQHTGDVHATAIVRGASKLILRADPKAERLRLFDVASDPGEHAEISAQQEELTRRLERALLQHVARDTRDRANLAERTPGVLDADEIAKLKALGYLQ
jgi:arylsulfatase A-like enzyme